MNDLRIWLIILAASITLNLGAAQAPETFKVSEYTITRPKDWKWVPTGSAMRKAQLEVTDSKTKGSAEVVFFHFGAGQGGDAQANVDRWLN